MDVPANLKYTKNHEWALILKDTAVVGITDYAQHALGDVVFIQLPEIGSRISKGDSFSAVESVKAASDIYAPVSGEVVEVNTALEDHPERINKSPYLEGWIAKVRIENPSEASGLLSGGDYEELLRGEEAQK